MGENEESDPERIEQAKDHMASADSAEAGPPDTERPSPPRYQDEAEEVSDESDD